MDQEFSKVHNGGAHEGVDMVAFKQLEWIAIHAMVVFAITLINKNVLGQTGCDMSKIARNSTRNISPCISLEGEGRGIII